MHPVGGTVRRRYALLVIVLTTSVGGGLRWGVLGPPSEAAPDPGWVHEVASGAIEETIIAAGVVRPAMTVEVRAEASGLVSAMLVDEGDEVRRGDVLVRLSSELAEAAVDEAEAQLRQAYLQEEATRLDLDHQAVELERRAYQRARALHERGLIARNDLEQHEMKLRLAERMLERNRGARRSSLAYIDQARAKVARARAQLEHTVVRAPFDAKVLRRFVDVGSGVSGVGQAANGGTVLMTLGDSRRSAFYTDVTAADAQRLARGMSARVRPESAGGVVVDGEVHLVSTSGELASTGQLATFPVVVSLNTARHDWVNVPARTEIVLSVTPDATIVPTGCVRTDDEGRSYVLREMPEGAERRDVTLGSIQPERLEILSGLEPGHRVRCR